ncbi:MAG: CsgG/HfaB family protein, partial [bacterium]
MNLEKAILRKTPHASVWQLLVLLLVATLLPRTSWAASRLAWVGWPPSLESSAAKLNLDKLDKLVESELLASDSIECVERKQIQHILAEQGLAAGDPGAAMLRLGGLLKAEFVAFGPSPEPGNSPDPVIRVRIVRVENGEIRGAFAYTVAKTGIEELAEEISRDVVKACGTDGLPSSSVAVGPFRKVGESEHLSTLEFGVRKCLVLNLLRSGRFRVLERENMDALVRENAVVSAGTDPAFSDQRLLRSAAYYLSGSIEEKPSAQGTQHLVIRARLSKVSDGTARGLVERVGPFSALEQLCKDMVAEIGTMGVGDTNRVTALAKVRSVEAVSLLDVVENQINRGHPQQAVNLLKCLTFMEPANLDHKLRLAGICDDPELARQLREEVTAADRGGRLGLRAFDSQVHAIPSPSDAFEECRRVYYGVPATARNVDWARVMLFGSDIAITRMNDGRLAIRAVQEFVDSLRDCDLKSPAWNGVGDLVGEKLLNIVKLKLELAADAISPLRLLIESNAPSERGGAFAAGGRILACAGEWQMAGTFYERAANEVTNGPAANPSLCLLRSASAGEAFMRSDSVADAIRVMEQARRAFPCAHEWDFARALAKAYISAGRPRDALRVDFRLLVGPEDLRNRICSNYYRPPLGVVVGEMSNLVSNAGLDVEESYKLLASECVADYTTFNGLGYRTLSSYIADISMAIRILGSRYHHPAEAEAIAKAFRTCLPDGPAANSLNGILAKSSSPQPAQRIASTEVIDRLFREGKASSISNALAILRAVVPVEQQVNAAMNLGRTYEREGDMQRASEVYLCYWRDFPEAAFSVAKLQAKARSLDLKTTRRTGVPRPSVRRHTLPPQLTDKTGGMMLSDGEDLVFITNLEERMFRLRVSDMSWHAFPGLNHYDSLRTGPMVACSGTLYVAGGKYGISYRQMYALNYRQKTPVWIPFTAEHGLPAGGIRSMCRMDDTLFIAIDNYVCMRKGTNDFIVLSGSQSPVASIMSMAASRQFLWVLCGERDVAVMDRTTGVWTSLAPHSIYRNDAAAIGATEDWAFGVFGERQRKAGLGSPVFGYWRPRFPLRAGDGPALSSEPSAQTGRMLWFVAAPGIENGAGNGLFSIDPQTWIVSPYYSDDNIPGKVCSAAQCAGRLWVLAAQEGLTLNEIQDPERVAMARHSYDSTDQPLEYRRAVVDQIVAEAAKKTPRDASLYLQLAWGCLDGDYEASLSLLRARLALLSAQTEEWHGTNQDTVVSVCKDASMLAGDFPSELDAVLLNIEQLAGHRHVSTKRVACRTMADTAQAARLWSRAGELHEKAGGLFENGSADWILDLQTACWCYVQNNDMQSARRVFDLVYARYLQEPRWAVCRASAQMLDFMREREKVNELFRNYLLEHYPKDPSPEVCQFMVEKFRSVDDVARQAEALVLCADKFVTTVFNIPTLRYLADGLRRVGRPQEALRLLA